MLGKEDNDGEFLYLGVFGSTFQLFYSGSRERKTWHDLDRMAPPSFKLAEAQHRWQCKQRDENCSSRRGSKRRYG